MKDKTALTESEFMERLKAIEAEADLSMMIAHVDRMADDHIPDFMVMGQWAVNIIGDKQDDTV